MGRTKDYGIGLDIGTSSIGISAVDSQGKLLNLKGKKAYSVYLYEEGKTAADRRLQRTTRRRLKRRKRRLGLLREMFRPAIEAEDPEFFLRQKYAGISPRDTAHIQTAKRIFNDRTDAEFYEAYPTIYHLRAALMSEKRQFDIREVYLAVRHIIKYRNHFLTQGNASDFNAKELDLRRAFTDIEEALARVLPDAGLVLTAADFDALNKILIDNRATRADRKKQIIRALIALQDDTDKETAKQLKAIITELANGIMGLKTHLDTLVGSDQKDKEWALSFDGFDDFLAKHGAELSDDAMTILAAVQELYREVLLAGIIPAGQTFSQHMVALYHQHAEDLKLFKAYLNSLPDAKRREGRQLYDQYISGEEAKPLIKDEFDKKLKAFVSKNKADLSDDILEALETRSFLPKLRTKDNSAIPYQVQQRELDQILANQGEYYPWLITPNPVVNHRQAAPYKIDELLTFRIPYYSGPLITQEDQEKTSGAHFAWMVRKAPGEITPWNYDEKVDRAASADRFIARMKTTDTYLLGEDVLPKQSLLYQRYEVLNELNMIRVNDRPLERQQKQRLYVEVFQNRAKNSPVRAKEIADNLRAHSEYAASAEINVAGLANETTFNSNLSTYHQLKPVLGAKLDDSAYFADIETIIAWATIFEDSGILEEKLQDITWLTDQQRQSLGSLRLRGWGQFSKRLLDGLKMSNGRTIIQELWETQKNLMRILADDGMKKAIEDANANKLSPSNVNEMLDDAYTSPSNKKAIRKVMAIISDIKRANGGVDPKWLFLETADGPAGNHNRSRSRIQQIADLYEGTAKEIVNASVHEEFESKRNNADFNKDRLFLYFMQNGRDLYTGERLNIDNLSGYDIDHIIPQAITKDDSLNNRVLVSAIANRDKGDRLAFDVFGPKQLGLWNQLANAGFLSKAKLANLKLQRKDFDQRAEGFIARQLVETRQIIKLTEQIAATLYPKTKIIAIKAGLTQGFRHAYDLPKNRDVNDYHHAFDSYLAAWIGLYMLNRYPGLEPFFVYGDYAKSNYKELREFNFIAAMQNQKLRVVDENGELLFGGPSTIDEMKKVYEYKHVTTVHETLEDHGAFYGATRYPASSNGSRKLIPLKDGFPTDVYGGYTQAASSYLMVVAVEKKKELTFRVIPVSVMQASLLGNSQSKSEKNFEDARINLAATILGIPSDKFKIVLPHLMPNQLFYSNENGYFLVRSDTMYRNYQQLWLSLDDQKVLKPDYWKAHSDDEISLALNRVFDHVVAQSNDFFSLYDINGFRKKLMTSVKMFNNLSSNDVESDLEQKIRIIHLVMSGLHANAKREKIPELGFTTPLGLLQKSNGLSLPSDSEVVYQSPSGLFERRISLSDLTK